LSSLQLVLIIAGVLLVVGVIVYNQWQERRLKGRTAPSAPAEPRSSRVAERVEPTLSTTAPLPAAEGTPAFRGDTTVSEFEAPVDVIAPPIETAATLVDETPASMAAATSAAPLAPSSKGQAARPSSMPDHEIECLIPLQPAAPVTVAALGAGLGARIGKPVRWFGRVDARSDWQRLDAETQGAFAEIVACLLLADRNGAASRAQLDTFIRVVGDVASSLPAAFTPPEVAQELARAEALDRLCAELDVQIGLTVQKPDPGSIAGTRLRGVAEAAGFRLAPGGRFEYAHEDTGAVLYTLQNLRPDPFTAESLRLTATNGVVFLLDVARTADPVRTFDQMKLAAKRLAKTLGAELVDDNHRPLDDAAFTVIREQVDGAVEALRAVHIEPGSARALALFSA